MYTILTHSSLKSQCTLFSLYSLFILYCLHFYSYFLMFFLSKMFASMFSHSIKFLIILWGPAQILILLCIFFKFFISKVNFPCFCTFIICWIVVFLEGLSLYQLANHQLISMHLLSVRLCVRWAKTGFYAAYIPMKLILYILVTFSLHSFLQC